MHPGLQDLAIENWLLRTGLEDFYITGQKFLVIPDEDLGRKKIIYIEK